MVIVIEAQKVYFEVGTEFFIYYLTNFMFQTAETGFQSETVYAKFVVDSYSNNNNIFLSFFSNGSTAPWGPRPPHYRGFTITHIRQTTLGRTPLDEGPARRRDLYLTTHNTHKRQTSMPLAGFEPTIPE
jgi:hypothetical protein